MGEGTKKHKLEMSNEEMYTYFDNQLKGMSKCPHWRCNCVAILADGDISASVMRYLCQLNVKSNNKQDSIVFERFKYLAYLNQDDLVLLAIYQ